MLPSKPAATLIRQSMHEPKGDVYQIGADLYIHSPLAPALSAWRKSIIAEQLKEIKFDEFSEKIDTLVGPGHNSNAIRVRKIIWDYFSELIALYIPDVEIRKHNGRGKFYNFSCHDPSGNRACY